MESEKRKNDFNSSQVEKRTKLELCPHKEKCYRRNPHHFKEYSHPHLEEYLDSGDDIEFPSSFTQDKQVYLEQIGVIKSLQKTEVRLLNSKVTSATPSSSSKPASKATPSKINKADSSKVTSILSASKATPSKINKADNSKVTSLSSASKATPSKIASDKVTTTSVASSSNITTQNSTARKIVKTTTFKPNSSQMSSNISKNCTTMKEKLESTQPYNIFFTKVPKAEETLTKNNCISFPDLICPSLGKLKRSLQINFMIDIMWLNEQYEVHGLGNKPMTILYGYEFPNMKEYMDMRLKNVSHHLVNMKDPFGTHHTKMGIYLYEDDTIRVVVSTANLYYEDWNHYNQGVWVSPPCPRMQEGKHAYECAGPTGFKTILLHYLNSYEVPLLQEWIALVKRADFTNVKVCLVTSIPGRHFTKDTGSHVQMVGDLLNKYCQLPAKTSPQSEGPLSWGVIAQASSIGSLGKNAGEWLRGVLLRSLGCHKQTSLTATSNATLNVVFPTVDNVMTSLFGAEGGGCLPYSKAINDKQKWLQDYLHQWKADVTGRSRAMPHMKSYCRISPCLTKLAYFLLTSANISKSAWGGNIQKNSACYVRSYEAGVLFLPHFFDEEYFIISSEDPNVNLFPFMYDLPLIPYKSSDHPWCN